MYRYSAVFLPMIARLLYFQHVCDGFDTRIILDTGKYIRTTIRRFLRHLVTCLTNIRWQPSLQS